MSAVQPISTSAAPAQDKDDMDTIESGPKLWPLKIQMLTKEVTVHEEQTERAAMVKAHQTYEWCQLQRQLDACETRAKYIEVLEQMLDWHKKLVLIAPPPKKTVTLKPYDFVLYMGKEKSLGPNFRARLRESLNLPKDKKFVVRKAPKRVGVRPRSYGDDDDRSAIIVNVDDDALLKMAKVGNTLVLQETRSKRVPEGSLI